MENKMREVAKLLGVELGEVFRIKNINCSFEYKLTAVGLLSKLKDKKVWQRSGLIEDFLTGHYQVSKKINPILDEAEKRYLSNIIKPFKDQVIAIAKKRSANYGEFIDIMIDEGDIGDCGNIYFPYFEPDSMYKGMKVNREYTLEQLGL